MNEIERLYENEKIAQEVRSNKMVYKSIALFFAFFLFIWALTALRIFIVPLKYLNLTAIPFILSIIIATVVYRFCDLSNTKIKYIFLTIVCIACMVSNATLSFHAALLYVLPLVLAMFYRNNKALWVTFCINIFGMVIGSITAFYYGICDVNILLKGNYTFNEYLNRYSDGMLTVSFEDNFLFIILFFEILPRALVLIGFTLMLRYHNLSVKDDMIRIASLTYGKDTDIATGVYNKNKLETLIEEYYPSIENIGVIYLDVNNLKLANDTYGHDFGDRVIDGAVRPLKSYKNSRYKSFRIGGDEFVLIIENPRVNEISARIRDIQAYHNRIVLPYKIKVSAALGSAEGKGTDIESIMKLADEDMYLNKRKTKGAAV